MPLEIEKTAFLRSGNEAQAVAVADAEAEAPQPVEQLGNF